MSKKKRPIVIKQGLDGWVMTYGDMMSLLLTFFVLIVSFSSMQDTKFKDAAMSLRRAFGVMVQPSSVIEFNDPVTPRHEMEEARDFLFELELAEAALLEADAGQSVEVSYTSDGVRFRIDAPVLFGAGDTDINPNSHRILDILAGFLGRVPGDIQVEGHSDAQPISTARFPSNWELSAARAGSVARYFQGKGLSPERIAATGYGEFHPLAANDTPEGRGKNRRVEIYLRLQGKPPAGPTRPVSEVLDGSGGTVPRPTPVTDRLRSLQRDS